MAVLTNIPMTLQKCTTVEKINNKKKFPVGKGLADGEYFIVRY